jgi:hypothetical protein
MLLHQFILVLVSAFKRFESHLLHLPAEVRRMVAREKNADSDLPEAETKQAA